MKRIVIEMENELHKAVKVHAFQNEISMKDYLTNLITKDLESKKEQTP